MNCWPCHAIIESATTAPHSGNGQPDAIGTSRSALAHSDISQSTYPQLISRTCCSASYAAELEYMVGYGFFLDLEWSARIVYQHDIHFSADAFKTQVVVDGAIRQVNAPWQFFLIAMRVAFGPCIGVGLENDGRKYGRKRVGNGNGNCQRDFRRQGDTMYINGDEVLAEMKTASRLRVSSVEDKAKIAVATGMSSKVVWPKRSFL